MAMQSPKIIITSNKSPPESSRPNQWYISPPASRKLHHSPLPWNIVPHYIDTLPSPLSVHGRTPGIRGMTSLYFTFTLRMLILPPSLVAMTIHILHRWCTRRLGLAFIYTRSGRAHWYRNYFDVYLFFFCSCVLQIIGVWLMPPLARLKTFWPCLVWWAGGGSSTCLGTVFLCMKLACERRLYVCTALECESDTRVYCFWFLVSAWSKHYRILSFTQSLQDRWPKVFVVEEETESHHFRLFCLMPFNLCGQYKNSRPLMRSLPLRRTSSSDLVDPRWYHECYI